MSSILIPTTLGVARIANASAGGFLLNLVKFKVTETINFVPGQALIGQPVYTGNIVTIESLNSGLVKFTFELPSGIPSTGQWNIGELGIYDDQDNLFAHGKLDPVYQKTSNLGLRIHAYISQQNIGVVTNASVGIVHSVPSYSKISHLPNPLAMTENVFSVLDGFTDEDSTVSPSTVLKYGPGGEYWAFTGYTRVYSSNVSKISDTEFSITSTIDFQNEEQVNVQVVGNSTLRESRRMKFLNGSFLELDNSPFVSLVDNCKVAIWRNPVNEIKALRAKVEANLKTGIRWVSTVEYNLLAERLNKIYGTPQGVYPQNFGYNQTPLPLVASSLQPTSQQWLNLYSVLNILSQHQTNATTNTVFDDFIYDQTGSRGLESIIANYSSLKTSISTVEQNKDLINISNLSISAPTTGSVTRTTSWTNSLLHEVLFTFESSNALLGYFNSGGKISFNASLTGGTDAHEIEWSNFLSQLANIIVDTHQTTGSLTNSSSVGGIYNLTNVFQILYRHIYVDSSGNPKTYTLQGKIENAGTQLRIAAQFSEGTGSSSYGYQGASNSGTFTSSCILYKANLANTVYPTTVSSRNF
jgi:Phage tail-collar fibre protein